MEIVTKDVDATCKLYAGVHAVTFGDADQSLGGARTAALAEGGMLRIRAPMHDGKKPVARAYMLVEDIETAVAVPDHTCELDFYLAILTTGAPPFWRDDLTNNLSTPIIGLGARTPEYDALPLQWMPHFQVADVAASASSAIAMGGKELMHGKGDEGQSQWAVLADPNGAAFGIIPAVPGESGNAQQSGRIGCTCGKISTVLSPV